MQSFLSNKKDAIAGISFEELETGILSLFHSLTDSKLLFPTKSLMTLHLEALILDSSEALPSYFEEGLCQESKQSKARGLALHLSKEFLLMGKSGGAYLKKWLETPGWQQTLWHQLFSSWNFPYELLEGSFKPPKKMIEVHLFNFSFIPSLYHKFLQKISRFVSIFYYQFSPCQEFWTDTVSDRERMLMQKKDRFEHEQDIFFKSHNSLLVNFGSVMRKNASFFEERDLCGIDHIATPSSTFLGRLQSDIFEDKVSEGAKIELDSSFAVYPAPSKLREVELLYTQLKTLSFEPQEVLVFAPDISEYAPYIQLVFGGRKPLFPFQINGLPRLSLSLFLQGFFDFISLFSKRFTLKDVFKICKHPFVLSAFQLKEQEVECFYVWMEKLGVKWGLDSKHRKELLSKSVYGNEMGGTFEQAFDILLQRLVCMDKTPTEWDVPSPDFSQAESLGKCIFLVRSIQKDLERLRTPMVLNSWAEYLQLLASRYFLVSKEEQGYLDFFSQKLKLLSYLGEEQQSLFSLSSIQRFLENAFKEKSGKIGSNELNTIHFSSLSKPSFFPCKMLYLLGMEESSFPKNEPGSSLKIPVGDFSPRSSDEDRTAFLQALLTPKCAFAMSYLSVNADDGKEQLPSLFIQEVLSYIETHLLIKQEALFKRFSPLPFHLDSPCLKHSKRHYLSALNFYGEIPQNPFIPEYLNAPIPSFDIKEEASLPLNKLKSFAKHPIRFYFNEILGVYLDYEKQDEEFYFSPLIQTLFLNRKSSSFKEGIDKASLYGKLPLGPFKHIAEKKLMQKSLDIEKGLKEFEIETLFSVPISLNIPLVSGGEVLIEGVIENVCSKGLVCIGSSKELLKMWPEFLAYCLFKEEGVKELLFLEDGKMFSIKNPQQALSLYLDYFQTSQAVPSPLLPAWGDIFFKKSEKELKKAVSQKIKMGKDPYIEPAFSNYNPSHVFKVWAPLVQKTFQPFGLI